MDRTLPVLFRDGDLLNINVASPNVRRDKNTPIIEYIVKILSRTAK